MLPNLEREHDSDGHVAPSCDLDLLSEENCKPIATDETTLLNLDDDEVFPRSWHQSTLQDLRTTQDLIEEI
jgi:hypothetical protein